MNKSKLLIIAFIAASIQANAQIEELFSAKEDAQTYLNHYMSPVLNGLMYNLNNGWYTTGKTHSKWGFDLTISATASMIPEKDKMFQFVASEYNHLSINSGSSLLPTAAGSVTTTTFLVATNNGDSITMDAPEGLGDEWPEDFFIPMSVPSPMIQIGLGIPSKTDIKLRYVPKLSSDEVSFNLFGLGIQHDLTQHIKVLEKIPTLSISGLGAFTNAKLNYIPQDSSVEGENQAMEMSINTYTLQLIGDINLKIVNFYLGMGYTAGTTNFDVLGTYKYDFDGNNTFSSDEIMVDPMKLKFEINGFKTTAGLRFNLGPVKLFADYTLQKYSSITAGLAISVR